MITTEVFTRNIEAYHKNKRLIINQGGTSSSKTYSILQLLFLLAVRKNNILISVVSESLPHLRRGALRDLQNIVRKEGYTLDKIYNKSSHTFTFGTSSIEFFPADVSTKLRGGRRDYLYINECNNITKNSFDELSVRTKSCTFLDFNPVSEFWAHEIMNERNPNDFEFIKSTYKNNGQLDESIIKEIESRKYTDPNWWKVYGEGDIGSMEGLIFSEWQQVIELPESPKRVLALDFGYTNDPTTINDIRYSDGTIYTDEICYQTKMTNQDIGNLIMKDANLSKCIVVCDSAEPKSIDELRLMGVRAIGSDKGADSINNGIDLIKQYKLCVTKRSLNTIKELRNYRWKTDKAGKSLNVPIDYWNHSMDNLRYGTTYLLGSKNKSLKNKITLPN